MLKLFEIGKNGLASVRQYHRNFESCIILRPFNEGVDKRYNK